MRKNYGIFVVALTTMAITACDDGLIYEKTATVGIEGRVVKLTGTLTGADAWADGYSVVLAGFEEGNDYPTIAKAVPLSSDGEAVELVMSGIGNEVETLELCAINRLRKRVATFADMECPNTEDTISMEVGELQVSMLSAIQVEIFNTTCANCHGGSTYAAAGLYLTEGDSYAALVGQPSTKVDSMMIVAENDTTQSVLHYVLNSNISSEWRYDHSTEVTSSDMLTLVDKWIMSGAKE